MGLQVRKRVMGVEHDLYLKIDGLEGHKKYTEITAGFYWNREVSGLISNRIETLRVPMTFERNSTGNPFGIAYTYLKAELDLMGISYTDIDSEDEEDISTEAADQSDNNVIASSEDS